MISKVNFDDCVWNEEKEKEEEREKKKMNGTSMEEGCLAEQICRREFKVTLIELQPYFVQIKKQFQNMVNFCCGKCASMRTVKKYHDVSDMSMEDISNSDFVFPFLGSVSAEQFYGFHFIPIFNTPSAQYITMKKISPKEMLFKLILSCAELWPLLLICLLMALISGFVAWLLETWQNQEEFPRPFPIGLFEGFWWSFISMTTVGYGDKTPQSYSGRIFSIFWIFIGITICSMFTAALTSEITSAMTTERPKIEGNQVGFLQGRLYEALLIAQHKGTLHVVSDNDWYMGVKKLYDLLVDNLVEGIALDTYIFNLFNRMAVNESKANYNSELHDLLVNRTSQYEIFNSGEKFSFGMLVRNKHDFHYFKRYFIDNSIRLETCNSLALNIAIPKHNVVSGLFSIEAGVFWPFFGGCMVILSLICAFGLVYELVRREIILQSYFKTDH